MKPFLTTAAAVIVGIAGYNLVKRFLPVLP